MRRRLLILPITLIAVALAAWFTVPSIKNLLAPRSVADVHRLRLGMTADEVREALGEPTARGFGTWKYGKPGELADTGVGVYFDANRRVAGWTDLGTGVNVGGPGEVRPAVPARGPWP